jgi:hypothetical protein
LLAEGHVTQQRVDETSLRLAELEAALAEADAGLAAIDVRLSKAEARAPSMGGSQRGCSMQGAVAGRGAGGDAAGGRAGALQVAIDPDLAETLTARNQRFASRPVIAAFEARLAELVAGARSGDPRPSRVFDLATGSRPPPARSTGEVRLVERGRIRGAWVPLRALAGAARAWTILVAVPA